jgi:endo-1,4-beta-xylanase
MPDEWKRTDRHGRMRTLGAVAAAVVVTGVVTAVAAAPAAARVAAAPVAAAPVTVAPPTATCRGGYVGLTFDDGPTGSTTALLAALRANRLRATMFNIGQNVRQNPGLARAQRSAGMWVANHSRLFRPPFGETDATVHAIATRLGLTEVLWDVDSQDWNGASTAQIVEAAGRLTNGQVILMHDGIQNTIDAIPQIASGLAARGLCPGMISPVTGRAVAPHRGGPPHGGGA